MYTLRIKERGGEESRRTFDQEEVSVGRGKNNDIVLPRGNVSKRHARIVQRGDKFFVVDLRSTNGTYFNARKINAPVVVTPEDKIYVGDFVLRLELGEAAVATDEPVSFGDSPSAHVTAPQPAAAAQSEPPPPPLPPDPIDIPPPTPPAGPTDELDDPVDTSAGEVEATDLGTQVDQPAEGDERGEPPAPPQPAPLDDQGPDEEVAIGEPDAPATHEATAPVMPLAPPQSAFEPQVIAMAAERVVDSWGTKPALAEAYGEGDLEAFASIVAGLLKPMVKAGELPKKFDIEGLAALLAGKSLLELLIAVPDVEEVNAVAFDKIFLCRRGSVSLWRPGFRGAGEYESELWRLKSLLGAEDERVEVRGRLAGDVGVRILLPPLVGFAPLCCLKKAPSTAFSLDDLVAAGALEANLAHKLLALVASGRSLLVLGPSSRVNTMVLNAITQILSADSVIGLVDSGPGVRLSQPGVISLSLDAPGIGSGLFERVTGLGIDTLVVNGVDSFSLAPFIVASHEVAPQVLASSVGRNLEGFVWRTMAICGEVTACESSGPALGGLVTEALDVLVQLETGRDGAPQVTRVAEVRQCSDGALAIEDLV